jgi:hypothetical protein
MSSKRSLAAMEYSERMLSDFPQGPQWFLASPAAIHMRNLGCAIFGRLYDRGGLTLTPEGTEVSEPIYMPLNFLATFRP